ncbi:MAG TPA: succinyl-diaminopimelate desuccinylase, partial [Mycobacteriales bacterium]|nr:succinyl-diaminopimelate desuccinylase [Mycobacteriales bacterium]
MSNTVPNLDLHADPIRLTADLVGIPSVSGDEAAIATAVEDALRALGGWSVIRARDAVVARTELGRDRRVILAGHLDTVPIADNVPSRHDGNLLYGCGTSDM